MMHQIIETSSTHVTARAGRWCILRTSSNRTLALDDALHDANVTSWAPRRTIRRPAPGNARRYVMGQRRAMVEVVVPILPGFVFVASDDLNRVLALGVLPPHVIPQFTLLRVADRVPLIGDAQIKGLIAAEEDAAVEIAAIRAEEGRQAERRARAERLSSERARRKALKRERRAFDGGQPVNVTDVPALAGLTGNIVESKGTTAKVHFGGSLTITVEAWQIVPLGVRNENTFDRTAA